MSSVSAAALALGTVSAGEAAAQTVPQIDEIIVTATRIVRDGYTAPTPVTVFSSEDLERSGEINAFASVLQLPSLAGSNSTSTFGTTQSTGTGGLSSLNLRGLGTNRTLTLLDGQRVVGALNTGVTDAGAFPQALVTRVDAVTGGASASWGSDAVAGVVNYVLDHNFVGVKGNFSGGVTTYGDNEQGIVALTAGTGFAGDRGHFTISGEYHDSAGVPKGIGSRTWYDGTRIIQRTIAGTPAGEPQYLVLPHVNDARLAPGGLITAGPLKGIAFGPGGTPFNFQYGPIYADPNMSGGDLSGDVGNNSNLDAKLRRETLYIRLSYDIADTVNAYVTFNHGGVKTTAHSYPGQYRTGNLTIRCDNAFLPSQVTALCAANNITQFAFGTYVKDLPDTIAVNTRTMDRFTAGLDGTFEMGGNEWNWSAYAAHGRTKTNSSVLNNTLNGLVTQAIDAIRDTNGVVVCRNTAARAAGCVPFNIIGVGVASESAINWVLGTPWLDTWLTQQVTAFDVSGDLFEGWAGPISIAFGAEYRKEKFHQAADVYSTGNGGNALLNATGNNWFTGNFRPASGQLHVWEAFAEAAVPVFNSVDMGKGEVNLAVRATDYSVSGYVTTWKVGATWETPLSGVRLRGLTSRDIRAPNLADVYRAPSNLTGTVIDRFAPFAGQAYTINQATLSSATLKPEKGTTKQVGIVVQPEWLPGLSASVDYYNIGVNEGIGTLSAQQTMDLCFQGTTGVCGNISRNGAGQVTEIRLNPFNLAFSETEGMDIEASYRAPVSTFFDGANGDITLRMLATHAIKNETNSGLPNAITSDSVGQNGGNIAKWRILATQTYNNDRYRLTLTERYVSPGVINNNWIECNGNCPVPTINNPTVNNNRIKGALYWDLGGSYKLTPDEDDFASEVYFKIDNVMNVDPPIAASAGINPYLVRSLNASLYDTLGRFYRVGFRFTYK